MDSEGKKRIELLCDNYILDDIINRFGKDVSIEKVDDTHFKAREKSSSKGMAYLVLQYIDYMEVLEPESLRKAVVEKLAKELEKYKTE